MIIPIVSCKSAKTQRKTPIKQASIYPIEGDWCLDRIDTTYRADGSRIINKIYKQTNN